MQQGGSLSMQSEVPPPTKPMAMHSRQQSKPHDVAKWQNNLAPPEYEHRRQGSASSLVEKQDHGSASSVSPDVVPGLDGRGHLLENNTATL